MRVCIASSSVRYCAHLRPSFLCFYYAISRPILSTWHINCLHIRGPFHFFFDRAASQTAYRCLPFALFAATRTENVLADFVTFAYWMIGFRNAIFGALRCCILSRDCFSFCPPRISLFILFSPFAYTSRRVRCAF